MRAALFDLDETILDRSGSLKDFVTWQAAGMLRSSIEDPSRFVERFIALDNNGRLWKDKVYESLVQEFGIVDWSVEELLSTYVLTFCVFCKPRAGAISVIEACRTKGFKIGLVSNGKSPFQERNFNALGISQLFDTVIVSEAVSVRKPEKAIFELACQSVMADIGSSVFIGDNPLADIKGAKEAGMDTIYVPVGPTYEPSSDADITYTQLWDVASYIRSQY